MMQIFHILRQFRDHRAAGGRASALRLVMYQIIGRKRLIAIRINGLDVRVRSGTPDINVALDCLHFGEFSEMTRLAGSAEVIVDAGGYIGTSAIALAQACPGARIIVLEPSAENYAVLCQNVADWPTITAVNAALSDRDGRAVLYDRGSGEWGFTMVAGARDTDHVDALGEIDMISIPTLMERFSVPQIDVLKLDIEGGEKAVLESADQWRDQVGLIVAELHDRIVAGCSEAFRHATKGWDMIPFSGEKQACRNPEYKTREVEER